MKKFFGALVAASMVFCLGAAASASEPVKIAFVDTGNTGRSLTAEELATVIIKTKNLPIAVISRAVDEDPFDIKPEPNAAKLLSEHGIDVSGHRAVQLNANDIRHADLILTMTASHKAKVLQLFPEAKDKVFTLAEYSTGKPEDVSDAYGKPLEVYQAMFKQVDGYLEPALDKATSLKKP